MRMRMVSPRILCRQHLLGEHGELHKHRPSFVKKHSIFGRIYPEVQIEPESMKRRHDELAAEMVRRGMKHNSPYEMPDLSYLPEEQRKAKVNRRENLSLLLSKCWDCQSKYNEYMSEGK